MKKKRLAIARLPISRRAQDKLRVELRTANGEAQQAVNRATELQHRIEQVEEWLTRERGERQALNDHILVLQSDRDRLTAALEVCVRRLASPAADRDVSRGGWRAGNRALQEQTLSLNEEAMALGQQERDRALARGAMSRRG